MPGRSGHEETGLTEAELLVLIRNRFPDPAYAFLPHVAEGTGGYGGRTADAIVMSVWPSRGLELMGMECKTSRADWLHELKAPAKAEAIAKYMDRWWLVVADRKIVWPGELPPTWGLLVAHGTTLRVDVEAPKLEPKPVNRSFLAAVFRNAGRNMVPSRDELDALIRAARDDGYRSGLKDGKTDGAHERSRDDELHARVKAFEVASGIDIAHYSYGGGATLGAAVRWVLSNEGMEGIRSALRTANHAHEQLGRVVNEAAKNLPPEFRRRV